jgi:hypothetical protein
MTEQYPMLIAYDMAKKQIGCVLLQVGFGGTIDNFSLAKFNNWLVAPTDNLKLYTIHNQEELTKAIELTNKAHPKNI